jgi:hypothetical protein
MCQIFGNFRLYMLFSGVLVTCQQNNLMRYDFFFFDYNQSAVCVGVLGRWPN